MAVIITSTVGMTAVMKSYYDKLFLKWAKPNLVMSQFGQKRNIPAGEGKTVVFTGYSPMVKATVALTEGANPTETALTSANVSATVLEWGAFVKISSLISLTAIDRNLAEKIPLFSQQASESIDWQAMCQVAENATAQVANSKDVSAITATDVLTTTEMRKALRTLKNNSAYRFGDGRFAFVVSPYTAYDITKDSDFVTAAEYSDIQALKNGEIGQWMGFTVIETGQPYQTTEGASSAKVYYNLALGMEAFGDIRISEGTGNNEQLRGAQIIVKNPGEQDTSNALNRFSTAGWVATYVAKVLNANWCISVKTGATQ